MVPPIKQETIPQITSEYNNLLGDLIESGMPYGEACQKAQMEVLNKNEDKEYYLGNYASPDEIRIRKVIRLDDLEQLGDSISAGGWNNLPLEKRNSLLYTLGMSVHRAGWWEEVGYVRKGSEEVITKYILSEERLDDAWINQLVEGRNVASDGARDAVWTKKYHKYDILKED